MAAPDLPPATYAFLRRIADAGRTAAAQLDASQP
jgi:hypothetical protein